jgi:hypothetical protein
MGIFSGGFCRAFIRFFTDYPLGQSLSVPRAVAVGASLHLHRLPPTLIRAMTYTLDSAYPLNLGWLFQVNISLAVLSKHSPLILHGDNAGGPLMRSLTNSDPTAGQQQVNPQARHK